MGYAGNSSPQFIIPSLMACREVQMGSTISSQNKKSYLIDDLDFFIGYEAQKLSDSKAYALSYPVRQGQIDNWDMMERFWEASIFKYLKREPEDHLFLLVMIIL